MAEPRTGGLATALDWHRWVAFLASRARQGARRVRGSAFSVLESAVGAAIAWTLAAYVLGRAEPLFAPIAAWVCLGFKPDRTPRKVAELGAGATLGVLIGEGVSKVLTVGPVQLVVVIMIAALVGRFLDNGDLFTMQSAVNAIVILVFASSPLMPPAAVNDRWIDALAGAFVAFVIAVLMPRRPTLRARRHARWVLSEFAVWLDMLAGGLRSGDVVKLSGMQGQRDALGKLLGEFEETLKTARDVTALNPALRRYRREVAELWRVDRLSRRAIRSTDMLARQSLGMTEEVGNTLGSIGGYVTDMAAATHRLARAVDKWDRPEQARTILLRLAGSLAPGEIESQDWRPVALMSLCRALTVDLLQLSGLSKTEARAALADTHGRPFAPRDHEGRVPEAGPDDSESRLWH